MMYLYSVWFVLAVTIAALALYRKYVSRDEDDNLHLGAGMDAVVRHQASLAGQLNWIDRWGKTLTVFAAVSGLALVAVWLFRAWIESARA